MSDADGVRAAAGHIERTGLHKGTLFNRRLIPPLLRYEEQYDFIREHGVPCCTIGALQVNGVHSESVRHAFAESIGVAANWVDDETGDVYPDDKIPDWNDAPERTAEEVVAALRAFADSLDAAP